MSPRVWLSPAENARLVAAFGRAATAYDAGAGEEAPEALLAALRGHLSAEAWRAVAAARAEGIMKTGELARLCAFLDLLSEEGLAPPLASEGVPMEVRVEGAKAYVLVPPEFSLLGSVRGCSLLWVHTEEWARPRFLEPGGTDFGLCGQALGTSKFVACAEEAPVSKGAALDALGLRGYEAFDGPGAMHVVRACGEAAQVATPMVPLLYLLQTDDATSGVARWEPADHFQEGTVPGYTSGLLAEVVIWTFQVPARSVDELQSRGVSCLILPDTDEDAPD